jgi:hypothetical protein
MKSSSEHSHRYSGWRTDVADDTLQAVHGAADPEADRVFAVLMDRWREEIADAVIRTSRSEIWR